MSAGATPSNESPLDAAAQELIDRLRALDCKFVLAESCTAGLIAATLGKTPGVSDYLCGSAVVYRNATKAAWLDVSSDELDDPAITAVSQQVAEAMALGVLRKTPEADLSASVTGYLGPDAAAGKDGVIWIGVAIRDDDGNPRIATVGTIRLTEGADRLVRQAEAAVRVLQTAAETLDGFGSR